MPVSTIDNTPASEAGAFTAENTATHEAENSDVIEEAPTRRQKLAASAFCFWGFLVFYLLSAGPIAGIHHVFKVRSFQKAVEVIYAPVVLLVKSNIEPFSSMMKWYVDLFR